MLEMADLGNRLVGQRARRLRRLHASEGIHVGAEVEIQAPAYDRGAMVPPIWPDEQVRPLPTYPCPRPGCSCRCSGRRRDGLASHSRH